MKFKKYMLNMWSACFYLRIYKMLFQYYFVPLFFALASCEAASSRIVSGTAPFRYEYQEDYLEIPEQVKNNLLNGHGLTKDKDGNVYFTCFWYSAVHSTLQALALATVGVKITLHAGHSLSKYSGTEGSAPSRTAARFFLNCALRLSLSAGLLRWSSLQRLRRQWGERGVGFSSPQ